MDGTDLNLLDGTNISMNRSLIAETPTDKESPAMAYSNLFDDYGPAAGQAARAATPKAGQGKRFSGNLAAALASASDTSRISSAVLVAAVLGAAIAAVPII